jgi:hypothetical protein
MTGNARLSQSRAKATLSGKCVRLREGLYKQLHEREWIFNRKEENVIFLLHKSGAYGVVVRNEDIDWKQC